ncbi:MAG TPA: uroporphyrinogen decarboxylase family protein [Bacteroidales bacterium]|nr:uroporphyrinogen decarboxylase [Bacteroidales bacterium]HNR42143.1 uroporphyrinogen decarboxylase family protein [Bacteroidales bacterium]HPM18937.1 uroporphyrinogen decarboxylase family protein [Bacteroidales bacterium]
MQDSSWNDLTGLLDGKNPGYRPVGFIIDSPWIPGWYGISMLDYYTSDELWLESNLAAVQRFPDVWFMPGFWPEYGMCTEPSAFGSRMIFSEKSLPHAEKIISDISDIVRLPHPDVRTDGLLPFVINRLKNCNKAISDAGHQVRFAVSRGPFNIASFLLGTTELMMAVAIDRENTHKLLNRITDFICDWLSWQRECFPSVDGVLILDDIIGFVGEAEFIEFVIPNLKRIFDSTGFRIKFLHNDADGLITARHLSDMGVNMFNFSFNHSLSEIRILAGEDIILAGNIPPRDVLAAGSASDVAAAVKTALAEVPDHSRIVWSAGGGMPPGVSSENIRAFVETVRDMAI